MVLKDLDLLLHKYLILYRYDISDRYVTKNELFMQKLKTLFVIIIFYNKFISLFNLYFDRR